MKIRIPFTTHSDSEGDHVPGFYAQTIEAGVTGYLESIQYIPDATAPIGSNADMALFSVNNLADEDQFPIWQTSNVSSSFWHQPRFPTHKSSDGTAISSQYAPLYLSGDPLIFVIDDSSDNPTGGTSGVILLRFSHSR